MSKKAWNQFPDSYQTCQGGFTQKKAITQQPWMALFGVKSIKCNIFLKHFTSDIDCVFYFLCCSIRVCILYILCSRLWDHEQYFAYPLTSLCDIHMYLNIFKLVFIFIACVTIKMASGHLTENQGLTPEERRRDAAINQQGDRNLSVDHVSVNQQ